MTTTKQNPPINPRLILTPFGDNGAIASYQWKVYRFLLDDGSTLDVTAIQDDSDLRGQVLAFTKAKKIEGVARVGEVDLPHAMPDPKPKTTEVKRTVKRAAKKAS